MNAGKYCSTISVLKFKDELYDMLPPFLCILFILNKILLNTYLLF